LKLRVTIISVIFLVVTVLIAGCTRLPGRVVNRTLTPEEMAIPPGRYQRGIDMRHTCQVEPSLIWSIRPDVSISTTNILIDGNGGIWYPDGDSGFPSTFKIIRLNPDGTTDFSHTVLPEGNLDIDLDEADSGQVNSESSYSSVAPILACAEGIIFRFDRSESSMRGSITDSTPPLKDEKGYVNLECFDTNGNIIWRTDPVREPSQILYGWRVSEDRIAIPVDSTNLYLYSLSDGELLETIEWPGPSTYGIPGPVSMGDGGWIFQGTNVRDYDDDYLPYVERVDSNGQALWHHEYPLYSFSLPAVITEDGFILRGNRAGVDLIDADSGSVIWHKFSGINHSCGITPAGDFLIAGFNTENEKGKVRLIDHGGNIIWTVDTMVRGLDDVIIYRDGAILLGYSWGISLFNTDGSIRWTVDLQELGLSGRDKLSGWSLNPTPDGGLAVLGHDSGDTYHTKIFYLGYN